MPQVVSMHDDKLFRWEPCHKNCRTRVRGARAGAKPAGGGMVCPGPLARLRTLRASPRTLVMSMWAVMVSEAGGLMLVGWELGRSWCLDGARAE